MAAGRIQQEKEIVDEMIRIYCEKHHQTRRGLCPECRSLLEYADSKLSRCFFGEDKPVCGKCPIHCYPKEMRRKITTVMRYAGPRMLFVHPLSALRHFRHFLKKSPVVKK